MKQPEGEDVASELSARILLKRLEIVGMELELKKSRNLPSAGMKSVKVREEVCESERVVIVDHGDSSGF